MPNRLLVSGPQSHLEQLQKLLREDPEFASYAPQPGELRSAVHSPLRKQPLGMEPGMYFIVAYAAHLTADLTAKGLERLLHKKAEQKKLKIQVQQAQEESPAVTSDTRDEEKP